jgi:uncharacterized integral membrane protein (TIGR00698 family)
VAPTLPAARVHRIRRLLPGICFSGAAAGLAFAVHALLGTVSVVVLALVLGMIVGTARPAAPRAFELARPGASWTAQHLLRLGVVLLGLQLAIGQVLGLGWRGLTVVVVTVCATFAGTLAVGRALRLPRMTTLLVATGFSICGAAAISAMKGTVDPDERHDKDAAAALALVTIFGSLAIVVLPSLASSLGLGDHRSGLWIGSSVQEVAQVVAAAGAVSPAALAVATVAKLARVTLLAPLVTVAGLRARTQRAHEGRRATPVPLFVAGFLAAVVVRSLGVLPTAVLSFAATVVNVLFAAALFAMGTAVDLRELVRTGRRVVVLGTASALVATGVALAAAAALG